MSLNPSPQPPTSKVLIPEPDKLGRATAIKQVLREEIVRILKAFPEVRGVFLGIDWRTPPADTILGEALWVAPEDPSEAIASLISLAFVSLQISKVANEKLNRITALAGKELSNTMQALVQATENHHAPRQTTPLTGEPKPTTTPGPGQPGVALVANSSDQINYQDINKDIWIRYNDHQFQNTRTGEIRTRGPSA